MISLTVRQRKDTELLFKRAEAFAEVRVTMMTQEGLEVTLVLDIESSVQIIGQMDEGKRNDDAWWRRWF